MKIKKVISKKIKQARRVDPFQVYDGGSVNVEDCKTPTFITGCGRSGTHFLAELFEASESLNVYHLDDFQRPSLEAFEFYSQWNDLHVSHEGFVNARKYLMQEANAEQKAYLESNPLIAFSMKDLASLDSNWIIVVRNPRKVVESHFRKGWYKIDRLMDEMKPSVNYASQKQNHNFSRILPKSAEDQKAWSDYPRLGKIAWMWQTVYTTIFKQLNEMDKTKVRWVFIENLDYEMVEELSSFIGVETCVSKTKFDGIHRSKPGKGGSSKVVWSEDDKKCFNREVGKVLDLFPKEKTSTWLFD